MNIGGQRQGEPGFTIPEVALAVGIVAFGLVAVFSILPFGLTAQKDNREETIIRYEAEYWFAVLQSGGQPLEALDRVETVELGMGAGDVYRVNRFDLDESGQAAWPVDVCGWLSAPDNRVPAKYALVSSINGSLFDRLNGARGKQGHYLPGGEFAFGYILETRIKPEGDKGTRLSLTFHWPISEDVEQSLQAGQSMAGLATNTSTRLANQKTFSILTTQRPRPALSYLNLDSRQQKFMHAGLAGEIVSIEDLQARFPVRHSLKAWDGYPRRLVLNGQGGVTILTGVPIVENGVTTGYEWKKPGEIANLPNLREAMGWEDQGLFLQIAGQQVDYPIARVNLNNGHFASLSGGGYVPTVPAIGEPYRISFLRLAETWEDVLSDFQRFGLVEESAGSYRYGSVYDSPASRGMTNAAGNVFGVMLDAADYWPAQSPSTNRTCSAWFLE